MSKNYAKISPRGEQRHRKNHSSSKPGYFIVLLLLIIGVTFYYVSSRGMFISTTRDSATASPSSSHPSAPAPSAPAKPRFEFYTLLSKETVPVPHDKNKTTNNVTADATTSEAESFLESAKAKELHLELRQVRASLWINANRGVPDSSNPFYSKTVCVGDRVTQAFLVSFSSRDQEHGVLLIVQKFGFIKYVGPETFSPREPSAPQPLAA